MKPERNRPGAREGAEIFPRGAGAETDVAVLFVEENFGLRWRDDPPLWLAALGRDESGAIGQSVKKAHAGRGRKIRREKTEVKIWVSLHRLRENGSKSSRIRAGPEKAVLEQSNGWMQFRQDPLILAAGESANRVRPEL